MNMSKNESACSTQLSSDTCSTGEDMCAMSDCSDYPNLDDDASDVYDPNAGLAEDVIKLAMERFLKEPGSYTKLHIELRRNEAQKPIVACRIIDDGDATEITCAARDTNNNAISNMSCQNSCACSPNCLCRCLCWEKIPSFPVAECYGACKSFHRRQLSEALKEAFVKRNRPQPFEIEYRQLNLFKI